MCLKTVIFDLDDTLYTDWDTCHEAGLRGVDAYGVRVLGLAQGVMREAFLAGRMCAIEHLGATGSSHNRVLFAQLGLEGLGICPIPHAQKLHQAYWDGVLSTMQREPALPALLDSLRGAGVCIAVCTNMMADIQMHKLCLLGLADQIDCLVTSEEAGIDKPQPGIFRYVLNKVGCAAEEAVMIGDNYHHDVCGAQSVGIAGIWINRKAAPLPTDGLPPAHTVHSMEEVAVLLKRLLTH